MNSLFDLSRPAVDPALVNEKVMAVDFGMRGGFVWNEDGALKTLDMPDNPGRINRLFSAVQPDVIYGENVHPFPGQGVVSVGTLMEGKGVIIGLTTAWSIRLEFVEPTEWTRWYQIGKRGDFPTQDLWKDHLWQHARNLYPNVKITKKCADAVLIWNFAINPQRIRKAEPPKFR